MTDAARELDGGVRRTGLRVLTKAGNSSISVEVKSKFARVSLRLEIDAGDECLDMNHLVVITSD